MQLKPPIIFTIKGMAKVLVGQLVDNARLVRREWGEDDSNGTSTAHPPTQQQHSLSRSLFLSLYVSLSLKPTHTQTRTHKRVRACVEKEGDDVACGQSVNVDSKNNQVYRYSRDISSRAIAA
jgi:hypothetical protein